VVVKRSFSGSYSYAFVDIREAEKADEVIK
jgi:hypothetical protein